MLLKYHLAGTCAILTTVMGVTTTAEAHLRNARFHHRSSHSNHFYRHRTYRSTPIVNSLELAVYQQVNQYRQSQNLPPLVFDSTISAQARAHSQAMAKVGNLSHDGFDERVDSVAKKIAYRSAAENVAYNMGYGQPDIVAIQGWIESHGHHQNMIGRYDLTGIGVVQNAKGEYYFTQIFIRKG